MAHPKYGTCYESAAYIEGAGRRLAKSNDYERNPLKKRVNWAEEHWDWNARLLMECAYHHECCVHSMNADTPNGRKNISEAWKALLRFREQYEKGVDNR